MKHWQDNGGLGALMDFLQRYKIGRGKVDIRRALVTRGLRDQQDESLEPFEQWLLEDVLWTGVVRCSRLGKDGSMEIARGAMYEQYVDWCKKMDIRGKKLTPKKFGIKFGSYFPRFNDEGHVLKAKNGRAISIFTGEDTTSKDGHLYCFPPIDETRAIIFKKMKRQDLSYWEGSAGKWSAPPNSAIFPDRTKTSEAPKEPDDKTKHHVAPEDDETLEQFINGDIVLPMGSPRRDN